MKFIFTSIDEETSLTKTFETDSLTNLIDHFDSFVRGCGFEPVGEIQDCTDDGILDFTDTSTAVNSDCFFFESAPEDSCEL